MTHLYCILLLMTSLALGMLYIPFFMHGKTIFAKSYMGLALFIVSVCVSGYLNFIQSPQLIDWLTYGKHHYDLVVQFAQLGGIDGAIPTIEKHVSEHPSDTDGWLLLHKLYLLKGDDSKALLALANAHKNK